MGWYVSRNGAQTGPYAEEQLQQMAGDGLLATSDYLWLDGGDRGWRTVAELSDMFPAGSRFAQPVADPAMRWIAPVGRSGWAIAAGYLGLFAVLLIFAPFALLAGIIAMVDIKQHPEKLGKGRAIFGLAMGAVFTTLLVVALVSG